MDEHANSPILAFISPRPGSEVSHLHPTARRVLGSAQVLAAFEHAELEVHTVGPPSSLGLSRACLASYANRATLHTHDPSVIPSFQGVATLLAKIVRSRGARYVVVGDYHTPEGIGLVPLLLATELPEYFFAPSARGIEFFEDRAHMRMELADGVEGRLPLDRPMIVQPDEFWQGQPAPSLHPAFQLAIGAVSPVVLPYHGELAGPEIHLPIRRPTSVVAPPAHTRALDRLRNMMIAWPRPESGANAGTLAGHQAPEEAAREILAALETWGVI
ncbi:MAG: hypothetical protein ACP5PJ_09950 [Acidimicrobiales bacterium]